MEPTTMRYHSDWPAKATCPDPSVAREMGTRVADLEIVSASHALNMKVQYPEQWRTRQPGSKIMLGHG